jgi:hypothetical protein
VQVLSIVYENSPSGQNNTQLPEIGSENIREAGRHFTTHKLVELSA